MNSLSRQIADFVKEKNLMKTDKNLFEALAMAQSVFSRKMKYDAGLTWSEISRAFGEDNAIKWKEEFQKMSLMNEGGTDKGVENILQTIIVQKDETIKRQDEHIQDLRKTLEILQDQLKGGREIAPSHLNLPLAEIPLIPT
jgi:hypothetical protein